MDLLRPACRILGDLTQHGHWQQVPLSKQVSARKEHGKALLGFVLMYGSPLATKPHQNQGEITSQITSEATVHTHSSPDFSHKGESMPAQFE